MNRISELIEIIKHENKLPDEKIINILSEAISEGKEENDIYSEMYVEVFGYRITKEIAEKLVKHFPVTDGSDRTNGEKFTMQEAKEYASRVGMSFNDITPCEFYLVMNSLYSDYFRSINKHGITDLMIYADMAYDWFNDEDADVNKTFNYFMR